MRARIVDWALLVLVLIEVSSGLGSFLIGQPSGRFWFVAHGVVGLSILLLIYWKIRRVRRRVTDPQRRQRATIVSILLALFALLSIGTGVVWTSIQRPTGYPNGMILHTTAGLVLLGLILWHFVLRFKMPTKRDLRDRRSFLAVMGLALFGATAWVVQDRTVHAVDAAGARRRFTGSRHAGPGKGNSAFPVTMWMVDNPAPLDRATYRLQIGGAVDERRRFSYAQLTDRATTILTATIDCTGGWYSTQEWSGIRVGDLLDLARPLHDARFVRFVSSTGYRWSLPLDEARQALLATSVGGELLSHGHGGPLRLVAPGRRGFQWVKWVVAVELLTRPDIGQWRAIYTSGID